MAQTLGVDYNVTRENVKLDKGKAVQKKFEKILTGKVKRYFHRSVKKKVKKWRSDVVPVTTYNSTRDQMILSLWAGGQDGIIYQYQDKGTEAHWIEGVPFLFFKSAGTFFTAFSTVAFDAIGTNLAYLLLLGIITLFSLTFSIILFAI